MRFGMWTLRFHDVYCYSITLDENLSIMFSNTITVQIIAIVELSFVLYVVDIVSSVAFSLLCYIKANPFCFERE